MSALADAALRQLTDPVPLAASPPAPVAFHYTQTDSFVDLLHQLGASMLVSTYQANKLLAVRASGQGLSTLVRTFDKPMGLAVDGSRLAIGTRKEVWFLRNAPTSPRRSSRSASTTRVFCRGPVIGAAWLSRMAVSAAVQRGSAENWLSPLAVLVSFVVAGY